MSSAFRGRLPSREAALAALFVLLTLGYAAWQYNLLPLDGDVAPIVAPHPAYAPVLHDPLGGQALLHHATYVGPNRFFAHFTLRTYLWYAPRLLQVVMEPIASVYVAVALFQLLVHAALLYALAAAAMGSLRLRNRRFWRAAAVLAPCFQLTSFKAQMGLIDTSVTYTCFYALPLVGLMGWLWPFYAAGRHGQWRPLPRWQLIVWAGLAVVLALSGPLIPGVALVIIATVGVGWLVAHRWLRGYSLPAALRLLPAALRLLPWQAVVLLGWLAAWCLYSLYLGQFNSESAGPAGLSLGARYALLPAGVGKLLTRKLGLPLLLLLLGTNGWVLRRHFVAEPEARWWLRANRWVAGAAVGYLLLLPLGGYRAYRELLVRYDTFLPITLALLVLLAGTTAFLLPRLRGRLQTGYAVGLGALALVFLNANRPLRPAETNTCQRQALQELALAPGDVVWIGADCPVLAWVPITDFQASAPAAHLLHHWRVTPQVKLYYQGPPGR